MTAGTALFELQGDVTAGTALYELQKDVMAGTALLGLQGDVTAGTALFGLQGEVMKGTALFELQGDVTAGAALLGLQRDVASSSVARVLVEVSPADNLLLGKYEVAVAFAPFVGLAFSKFGFRLVLETAVLQCDDFDWSGLWVRWRIFSGPLPLEVPSSGG